MRTARKAGFALLLAAFLAPPLPAPALTLSQAAARLAAIDGELAACLRARLLVAVIVVQEVRKCLADKRPDERALRGDLNDWISTLGGDDPDRARALGVRMSLNVLRAFMNALDARLKALPERAGQGEVEREIRLACAESGIGGAGGAGGSGGRPAAAEFDSELAEAFDCSSVR